MKMIEEIAKQYASKSGSTTASSTGSLPFHLFFNNQNFNSRLCNFYHLPNGQNHNHS